jgi:hypothetical protein
MHDNEREGNKQTKYGEMKEELTTLMHLEFCKDEKEELEMKADGVYFDVFRNKRLTFEDALKRYQISEEQVWENMTYNHIFDFPKQSLEEHREKYGSISRKKHNLYKACKNNREICQLCERLLHS